MLQKTRRAQLSANLLFNDEFNYFDPYSKTDTWKTSYHWGANYQVNNETGYYVDTETHGKTGPAGATNPFSVFDGVLSITAKPQSGLPNSQTYASGVISSMGLSQQTYGYYEIRAQMPHGNGFWPAFWLMRADKQWPPELDVMEFSSRLPNEYVTTLHSGMIASAATKFSKNLPDLSNGFHTYGVDWQSDKVRWYFDGTEVFSVATPSDMKQPMYMLLNLAVGGNANWIGPPDGTTQQYKIDYVHVYDTRPTDAVPQAPPTPVPVPVPVPTPLPLPETGEPTNWIFGDGRSTLTGTNANDFISNKVGVNETMRGGGGDDTYIVWDQWDKVVENAGSGIDTTVTWRNSTITLAPNVENLLFETTGNSTGIGNELNNILRGGVGTERLEGRNGNDVIVGGQGPDKLYGGSGSDTFVYTSLKDAKDTIGDFTKGVDKLDLRALMQITPGAHISFSSHDGGLGVFIESAGVTTELVHLVGYHGAALTVGTDYLL